jgi:O-acetyl-ADP-ribose deacetylase (regulator of RNase III)
MIHDVSGDILLTRAQAIAHGVAPHDGFHSGLARALRERWPPMYRDFRHWCRTAQPKCGEVWCWGGPDIRIAALLTQEPAARPGQHPGRASLTHVNHALRELRQAVVREGYRSLALPRLATGVGALPWAEVQPLIAKHLGDLGIPVYVYAHYTPGVAGAEAGSAT